MSNMFKNQSRFSILNENNESINNNNTNNNNKQKPQKPPENSRFNIKDDDTNKQNHNFKDNEREHVRERYNNRERYGNVNSFNYDPEKERKKAEKIKQEEIEKALSMSSFPVFINNAKIITETKDKNIETPKISFLEKLNLQKEVLVVVEERIITPGWVELTYDKEKRHILYNCGKPVISLNNKNTMSNESRVLHKLVENHETWKENYIQMWGEDEYERLYRFPNYDYDYFNKLDEEYERQQEEYEIENCGGDSDEFD